jgi:hypothetical protein
MSQTEIVGALTAMVSCIQLFPLCQIFNLSKFTEQRMQLQGAIFGEQGDCMPCGMLWY